MAKNPFIRNRANISQGAGIPEVVELIGDERREQLADKLVEGFSSLIDAVFENMAEQIKISGHRQQAQAPVDVPLDTNETNGLVGDVLVPQDQIVNTGSSDSGLASFNNSDSNKEVKHVK